jgi:hypothetical protein
MALSLGGIEIVRPSNLQFQKQELHQAAVAHWYAREKERAGLSHSRCALGAESSLRRGQTNQAHTVTNNPRVRIGSCHAVPRLH